MHFIKKAYSLVKRLLKWISKNNDLVILILTLISLYVAYKSLKLADYSLKYSIEQNEINSKTSDSLFNVQLSSSKRLNDSIINEINRLRNITDNQLKITQEQLLELKIQSKPRIAVTKFRLNSFAFEEKSSEVNGELAFLNVGNREALNLTYKSFLIQPDFSKISDLSEGSIINKLNSEEEYNFDLNIKAQFKLSENFYIYFCLYYYDFELNKVEFHEYFYKYWDSSHGVDNFKCNQEEINKLQKIVKQYK